jgi:site-specific DNA recombinase
MADLYRQKVTMLAQALEQPETRVEATEALRGLIDAITLTPTQGELRIELKGNLAAMLSAATNAKRSPETGDLSLQVEMVAGARSRQWRRQSTSWPRRVPAPSYFPVKK